MALEDGERITSTNTTIIKPGLASLLGQTDGHTKKLYRPPVSQKLKAIQQSSFKLLQILLAELCNYWKLQLAEFL